MIKFIEIIITALLGMTSVQDILKGSYITGGIFAVFAIINAVLVIRAYIDEYRTKKEIKEATEMFEEMLDRVKESIEKRSKEKKETENKTRTNKKWTNKELTFLKENYHETDDLQTIANSLGRTK